MSNAKLNEFAQWMLSFDESLVSDSKQAALLRHNVTSGNVREYLVSEVLQRFLPSTVSIESGMVIDHQGRRSKQVDVILFDSRAPALRSRLGPGLFPVEGVLAAIEIKTSISSTDKLIEALNNCASVAQCEMMAVGDFEEAFHRREKELIAKGMTPLDAYARLRYSTFPPTYILAIENGLSCSALSDGIDSWFHRNKDHVETVPIVPRLILCGQAVGIANDGMTQMSVSEEVMSEMISQLGPQARVLMSFWPHVKHRLSWFATHLLMSINMRMGISHQYLKSQFDIERYMPFNNCFQSEYDPEQDVGHVFWNGRFPKFSADVVRP